MKIANPTGKTLESLFDHLLPHYPGAKIRKAVFNLFGPQHLILPSGNMKHIVRPVKNNTLIITDFIPPVLITIAALVASVLIISLIFTLILGVPVIGGVGGLGFILLFLLIKALYKSANKQKFEQFHTDLNMALAGSSQPGSIF
ncbi:hypothetical protein [Niabella drilacis]|uniref:Uncharacterized protein n=1 Tax=Niabella drilacis (strain DSM 25811 / CCM 8410 / CCUG 62505 / LMG 26954 / E90) TaxID=1285928 RepID=A0A1G6KSM3_NIADE|nr:hypothetical protein [Niabella drilacis]SDC33818.1 hypothetical protein SAMN04487894_10281 [Niabella drilacis]